MAEYTIRGESYLGKRTGPKIVFGVAKINPAKEAVHASDINLRRIHNIFFYSGGEKDSSGSYSYYEVKMKSTELDVNAAEGSLDNYASLDARMIGKSYVMAGSPLAASPVATLVLKSIAGSQTIQFIAFGD